MVLFQPGLLCDSGDLLRDAVLSAVPLNWQVAGFSAMLTDSTSFAKVSKFYGCFGVWGRGWIHFTFLESLIFRSE